MDVGSGPNSSGSSINFAAVMWSLSGSWIGCRALCATCSRIMEQLGEAEAGFRSLTEAIDTTTPAGRMMMQMVGAFAEFERAMLRERTQAGVDAARQQGRLGGRRPKLSPQHQSEIRKMVWEGDKTAAAARLFNVHPATVSRLARARALDGFEPRHSNGFGIGRRLRRPERRQGKVRCPMEDQAQRVRYAYDNTERQYDEYPPNDDVVPIAAAINAWTLICGCYMGIEQTMKLLIRMRGGVSEKILKNTHNLKRLYSLLDPSERDVVAAYYRVYRSLHNFDTGSIALENR